MSKIVYVTGCLGFIGYALTIECLNRGWYVIGVDKQTYAANTRWLSTLLDSTRFKYIKSDINDLDMLYDCDAVINTAAETHVDNSIVGSDKFMHTNINGVKHLLSLVLTKKHFKMPTFVQFSTDEVYGDIDVGSHDEKAMLKPSNPYSATKASADMLISAWARTYGVPYVIVRPTNNYGIGQYVEKLIPKTVKMFALGRPVDLHEEGKPRRTWLHVDDTAFVVAELVSRDIKNEIFNITSNVEKSNLEVVTQVAREMDYKIHENIDHWITHVQRQGQDVRYSIDDSKVRRLLDWNNKSIWSFELKMTVDHYMKNFVW